MNYTLYGSIKEFCLLLAFMLQRFMHYVRDRKLCTKKTLTNFYLKLLFSVRCSENDDMGILLDKMLRNGI